MVSLPGWSHNACGGVGFCVRLAAEVLAFDVSSMFLSEYLIHSEMTGGKSEVAFLEFCGDFCVSWFGTGRSGTGAGTITFVSACTFWARAVY